MPDLDLPPETVMIEPGRLDWARAAITMDLRSEPLERVHFWGSSGTFHVESQTGEHLGTLTVRADENGNQTIERIDSRSFRLTAEDGTQWTVSKRGCNCQGG